MGEHQIERRRDYGDLSERMTALEGAMNTLVELKKQEQANTLRMHDENQRILHEMVRVVYGDEKTVGLINQVREIAGFVSNSRRIIWIGGGLLSVDFFRFLLTLFRQMPTKGG